MFLNSEICFIIPNTCHWIIQTLAKRMSGVFNRWIVAIDTTLLFQRPQRRLIHLNIAQCPRARQTIINAELIESRREFGRRRRCLQCDWRFSDPTRAIERWICGVGGHCVRCSNVAWRCTFDSITHETIANR